MNPANKFVLLLLYVFPFIFCACQSSRVLNEDPKIDLISDEWPGWAISYSGYREGQDPQVRIFPSREEVAEDLKLLDKKNMQFLKKHSQQ